MWLIQIPRQCSPEGCEPCLFPGLFLFPGSSPSTVELLTLSLNQWAQSFLVSPSLLLGLLMMVRVVQSRWRVKKACPDVGSRAGLSDISSTWSGKDQRATESQRSEQCWLQKDGFQGASVLQWLSPAPLTKEGGGGGYDSSWQSCVVIWGGGRIVCAYVGPFFKQGEIG